MTVLHTYHSNHGHKQSYHCYRTSYQSHACSTQRPKESEKRLQNRAKRNRKKEQGVGARMNEWNYEKERNESFEAGRREGESRAHLEACRARELGAQGWKLRFRNTVINLTSDSQHKGHNNSY